MSQRKQVYLHVGCPKTGTSYLQVALRASERELADQGLGFPFGAGRPSHVRGLLVPALKAEADPEHPALERALTRLGRRVAASDAPRQLVTLEDLGRFDETIAHRVVASLDKHEVHVVLTARHWGKQLPSDWQQRVKMRSTRSYEDYIADVRDRAPGAEEFLSRQHVPEIARRWGALLPPGRVHIVAVPPSSGATGPGIVELFCRVLGVDAARLSTPLSPLNTSLGYEQAELLRRVNLALGPRLADVRGDYRFAVRGFVTRHSLMQRDAGAPIVLPAAFVQWCHEESRRLLDELTDAGFDVVGDPEHLVCPDTPPEQELPEVSAEQVAEVAVQTIADLAVVYQQERRASRKQLRAVREAAQLPAERPQPATAGSRVGVRTAARKVRGVARRLLPTDR